MNKSIAFLVSSVALLAFTACSKDVNEVPEIMTGELAVCPLNDATDVTKGYVEGSTFVETGYEYIHGTKSQALRTMQLSAYLTPQNGAAGNYFVDKTFSAASDALTETTWWNTNTVNGAHDPIYWPVGGNLDFLAYSVSSEVSGEGKSHNVTAVWDETNAASMVTLSVPGENTQNDILFASVAGVLAATDSSPVSLTFKHAQSWLEFVLTGTSDEVNKDGVVTLNRIELENIYNAGTLSIRNNGGNASAKWDFTGEDKQNIKVDDFNSDGRLTASPKYYDMLIPQQAKTAFVIYYTLGSDSKELSYRFTTDQKTWLMGEKYIYTISITASEVSVSPKVTPWSAPVQGFNFAVSVKSSDETKGTVSIKNSSVIGGHLEGNTIRFDTWGGLAEISAVSTDPNRFVFTQWNDGNTDNVRTIVATRDFDYVAGFTDVLYSIKAVPADGCEDMGSVSGGGDSFLYNSEATLKATPKDPSKYLFLDWSDLNSDAVRTVTVTENSEYEARFTCRISIRVKDGDEGKGTADVVYTGVNKAMLTAAPNGSYQVKWYVKNGSEQHLVASNLDQISVEVTEPTEYIVAFVETI
ncbi:MAG: fimbrillin family protein [Bacteroidales bacterium]|nr:fimbrillin family protein [Candidatus Cacconaster merdequi]